MPRKKKSETIIDFSKLPKWRFLEHTLSPAEASLIAKVDPDLLEERKRAQRKKHKEEKEKDKGYTYGYWESVVKTFQSSGFTRKESEYLADEGVTPDSETGMDLIAKRMARVSVYEEYGLKRSEAIKRAADDLVNNNRKKGNIDTFVFSESTVI
jgi:hypothetical protein